MREKECWKNLREQMNHLLSTHQTEEAIEIIVECLKDLEKRTTWSVS